MGEIKHETYDAYKDNNGIDSVSMDLYNNSQGRECAARYGRLDCEVNEETLPQNQESKCNSCCLGKLLTQQLRFLPVHRWGDRGPGPFRPYRLW